MYKNINVYYEINKLDYIYMYKLMLMQLKIYVCYVFDINKMVKIIRV